MAGGSAGRALALRRARPAPSSRTQALAILRDGDPTNARRADARRRAWRARRAAERYAAFLDLVPVADRRARRGGLDGPRRERALDAYAQARELAALAPRLSLDPGGDRVPARRDPRRGRAAAAFLEALGAARLGRAAMAEPFYITTAISYPNGRAAHRPCL